jgi:hypothetical protein
MEKIINQKNLKMVSLILVVPLNSNVNDSETKAERSFDLGFVFDIEAKTNLIIPELVKIKAKRTLFILHLRKIEAKRILFILQIRKIEAERILFIPQIGKIEAKRSLFIPQIRKIKRSELGLFQK